MVDIAGAAAGPQLFARPDPLTNGAQASQIATDNVSPDQASGVTAGGNLDADGDGTESQGDFENPASGGNVVQAQLAGSQEELAGAERPLSPIEEVIRDFPPDAVVQREEAASLAPPDEEAREGSPVGAAQNAEGNIGAGTEAPAEFGVTEAEAGEQSRAAAQADEDDRAAGQAGTQAEPERNLSGASEDPFNITNGSAGSQSATGSPAAQPPGSTVDIAA